MRLEHKIYWDNLHEVANGEADTIHENHAFDTGELVEIGKRPEDGAYTYIRLTCVNGTTFDIDFNPDADLEAREKIAQYKISVPGVCSYTYTLRENNALHPRREELEFADGTSYTVAYGNKNQISGLTPYTITDTHGQSETKLLALFGTRDHINEKGVFCPEPLIGDLGINVMGQEIARIQRYISENKLSLQHTDDKSPLLSVDIVITGDQITNSRCEPKPVRSETLFEKMLNRKLSGMK